MKRLCLIVIVALMALPVFAQEATPETTPETTPDAESAESTIEATAEATAQPTPDLRGLFTEPGIFELSQTYAGIPRSYLISIPERYFETDEPAGTFVPLIIALHGAGGRGEQMVGITGLSELSETEGFIVVYPDGLNGVWNDGRDGDPRIDPTLDDLSFINGIIETAIAALNVDETRVYLTGYSMGGFLAQRVACVIPQKIAGIAVVAATMPQYVLPDCQDASIPMPFMLIHGTNDTVVPWLGVVTQSGSGYLSALDTAYGWANRNGCDFPETIEALPDVDPDDGTRVMRETYEGCIDDSTVVLLGVYRGGHTWAGTPFASLSSNLGLTTMDIQSSVVMWEFFSQHAR